MKTKVIINHLFTITAAFALLFACSNKKERARWISDPAGSYFVPSMDSDAGGKVLSYGAYVILLEETRKVIYYDDGEAVIDPGTGDTAYWTKILWNGEEGYTSSNGLTDSALFYQDRPRPRVIFRADGKNQEQLFALANAKNEVLDFDLEGLKRLLLSNNWSKGSLKLHFQPDFTCIWEAQDSNTGKWYLTEYGEVILYESHEAKDPTSVLSFDNTFTLVSKESGRPHYYSLEYYQSFAVSPESQKATEIPLHEIDKTSFIGTWVITDGVEDGLLLGYKFGQYDFYLGDNSISDLHGYWDDADYVYMGSWHFDKSRHAIKLIYTESKEDTVTISINKFYNAAFEGVIKSTGYIDEGGDSPRTFYKSNGKFILN